MKKLQRKVGKKAVKATTRHSIRGLGSKAKRQPVRSATLLSAGGAVGAVAGFLAGRKST
jgi:hypothetical protein